MSGTTTMGAYLTAARLRQRVSIQRAAEETRIKKDYLMRMESDEFDFLAPAYVRGFLRTYARFLHADPEPLLAEFDRRYAHAVDASQIVALERRARRVPKEPRRLSRLGVILVAIVGAVLLFAIVGLLTGPGSEPASDSTESPRGRAAAPTVPAFAVPTPTESPTPGPTRRPPSITQADLADGIELEIVAVRAQCWVDVDVDGLDVFSETLVKGDSMSFTADSLLEVVLGNPRAVDLVLNGRRLVRLETSDPVKFSLPDELEKIL